FGRGRGIDRGRIQTPPWRSGGVRSPGRSGSPCSAGGARRSRNLFDRSVSCAACHELRLGDRLEPIAFEHMGTGQRLGFLGELSARSWPAFNIVGWFEVAI